MKNFQEFINHVNPHQIITKSIDDANKKIEAESKPGGMVMYSDKYYDVYRTINLLQQYHDWLHCDDDKN